MYSKLYSGNLDTFDCTVRSCSVPSLQHNFGMFFVTCKKLHLSARASNKIEQEMSAVQVREAVIGIVKQQSRLLQCISDEMYAYHCPLLKGTTGGHVRHSLDHIRRALEQFPVIRYDIRERNTVIEKDRIAALKELESLLELTLTVDDKKAKEAVQAAFMLTAEGKEILLNSTVEREMAFAVHHCIHHNAMIKGILQRQFPSVKIPDDFGLAPSTANFRQHEN